LERELLFLKHSSALLSRLKENSKIEKLLELVAVIKKKIQRKDNHLHQFRSTQADLAARFGAYRVVLFHGSLGREEKDQAITDFRGPGDIFILPRPAVKGVTCNSAV